MRNYQEELRKTREFIGNMDSENACLNLGMLKHHLEKQKWLESQVEILKNEKIDFLKIAKVSYEAALQF